MARLDALHRDHRRSGRVDRVDEVAAVDPCTARCRALANPRGARGGHCDPPAWRHRRQRARLEVVGGERDRELPDHDGRDRTPESLRTGALEDAPDECQTHDFCALLDDRPLDLRDGSAGRSARCASSIPAPELDPWAAGCAPARTPPHGRKPSGVRMTTLIQGVYLRRSVCVRRGSIAECRSGTGAPPENALVPSPDPRHPRRIPCPPEPSTTTAGLLRLRVRSVFVWSGGGAPWLRAGARARGTRWVVRPSPAAGARRRACS
jgi:hypothetical protein